MSSSDVSVASRGRDVIVETVRVLLAAGSDITATASDFRYGETSLLDCLFDLVDIEYWRRLTRCFTHQLQLVVELMQLLATSGATLKRHAFYWQFKIIFKTETLLYDLPAPLLPITATDTNTSEFIDTNIVSIDILCDISRVFLLSDRQCFFVENGFAGSHFDAQGRRVKYFISSFISIVGCSPQCSVLMRLIHLLFDVIGMKGVTKLENMLMFDLQHWAEAYSPEDKTRINNTLMWMRGLQPRVDSLQHIARKTILRAMSYRSLCGAETLGLPVHLKQYVLLENN